MDDVANEWCNPTRELTKTGLAKLVRRSHRTSRVQPLSAPVPPPIPQRPARLPPAVIVSTPREPVYPTYPGSPTLARLGLATFAVAAAAAGAAVWLGWLG